jgi:hypothetical protein
MGGSLAHTRRLGDNGGMAGDDSRAQVQLDEDTLARRRRVLGEDHPDTLTAASNLAVSLRAVCGHPGTLTSPSSLAAIVYHPGEYQAARELDEDTLARRRRVLGEDHPDTLLAAFILVGELTQLGEYQAAKELNEDILDRRRRVLGDRHLDTLGSAAFALILSGLAADPKARAAWETMKAAGSQPGEGREPGS